MQRRPKICLVGAGGISFGPLMVNDVIHSAGLRGAQMMLHDVDPQRLEMAYRLASRMNAAKGSPVRLDWSLDPAEAMTGADFCLISAEVKRWPYWHQDYEVPLRHGATHITGENGGPGRCSTRCAPSRRRWPSARISPGTARTPSW
jgi:alpha-galactosidase